MARNAAALVAIEQLIMEEAGQFPQFVGVDGGSDDDDAEAL